MGASYHKANFIIMKEKNSKRLHSDVQDSHLFPSFFFAFLPDACHHKMFGCLSVWRFLLFFAQQSSCSRERYSFLPLGQALLSQFISSYLSALTFIKGTLLHSWWECKLIQPLWRTVWKLLNNLEIKLPYNPPPHYRAYTLRKPQFKKAHVSQCLLKQYLQWLGHGRNQDVHLQMKE